MDVHGNITAEARGQLSQDPLLEEKVIPVEVVVVVYLGVGFRVWSLGFRPGI